MLYSYRTLRIFYFQVKEICKIFILSVYFMLGMMKGPTHSSVTLVLIFPQNIDGKHPERQLLV